MTKKIFQQMVAIRTFEQELQSLYEKKILDGTVHLCIGQEMNPVCTLCFAERKDFIFSHHRGHGHYLVHTKDYKGLLDEILGLPTGCCGGNGGSQHLHKWNFFSNGILGSTVPWAIGTAQYLKETEESDMVFCWLTDGMMNQGVVYEALRMAVRFPGPILFILENNHYAISTPAPKDFSMLFKGIGLKYALETTRSPKRMLQAMERYVEYVRTSRCPLVIEIDTFRFCGHSKSDNMKYIDKDLRQQYIWDDPLGHLHDDLEIAGMEPTQIRNEVENEIHHLFEERLRQASRKK